MPQSVPVPALGESITEGFVAQWLKAPGESVAVDEPVVEIETDKITVEVPSPVAGALAEQFAAEGDTIKVGDAIFSIEEGAAGSAAAPAAPAAESAPAAEAAPAAASAAPGVMPAARAEADRQGIDPSSVTGTGRGGRVLKEDVQAAAAKAVTPKPAAAPAAAPAPSAPLAPGERPAPERARMSPLRRRIAERLLQAQQSAAILTTFNEVDMSAVIALRKKHQDAFVKKYGIKLGFMSFFAKAAAQALADFPAVNAEIQDDEIVYHKVYDIGVAVGGGKGLVVPVVRNCDQLGFAQIEQEIARLAGLAKTNKLQLSDLTGGTFTISNGGIYGSMLSTPILNPPQTGILGLHNIVQRPVAVNGQVEIRPVMYLALSYDHRLVDGREAVQFLVRIKECIEAPERMLFEV